MEEELKCPVCRRLCTNPIVLPCNHSICLACGISLQNQIVNANNSIGNNSTENVNTVIPVQIHTHGSTMGSDIDKGCSNGSNTITNIQLSGEIDFPDIDKLSLLSETDSGVAVNSRPNSYVGTPNVAGFYFNNIHTPILSLACPVCKKFVYLDDQGANSLPKNRVLEAIVDKYVESKNIPTMCQLCVGTDIKYSTFMCEQCEVFYCDSCLENCHPARGPLAQHSLVTPFDGKAILRNKHKVTESKCSEHTDENLSLYCVLCKMTICCVCSHDGKHFSHETQPLGGSCKLQKVCLYFKS